MNAPTKPRHLFALHLALFSACLVAPLGCGGPEDAEGDDSTSSELSSSIQTCEAAARGDARILQNCQYDWMIVYRYFCSNGRHVSSLRYGIPNCRMEGSFRFAARPAFSRFPLYSCMAGSILNPIDFMSRDPNCEGHYNFGLIAYSQEGWNGYPIYRCRSPGTNDHFISRDPGCEGKISEGEIGRAW